MAPAGRRRKAVEPAQITLPFQVRGWQQENKAPFLSGQVNCLEETSSRRTQSAVSLHVGVSRFSNTLAFELLVPTSLSLSLRYRWIPPKLSSRILSTRILVFYTQLRAVSTKNSKRLSIAFPRDSRRGLFSDSSLTASYRCWRWRSSFRAKGVIWWEVIAHRVFT